MLKRSNWKKNIIKIAWKKLVEQKRQGVPGNRKGGMQFLLK